VVQVVRPAAARCPGGGAAAAVHGLVPHVCVGCGAPSPASLIRRPRQPPNWAGASLTSFGLPRALDACDVAARHYYGLIRGGGINGARWGSEVSGCVSGNGKEAALMELGWEMGDLVRKRSDGAGNYGLAIWTRRRRAGDRTRSDLLVRDLISRPMPRSYVH
jgi:hypothetical protein